MAKIIEIVGTDYYDCSNPHVILLDGVDIKEEHSNYKKLPSVEQKVELLKEDGSPWGCVYDFGSWLVHHKKARWPDDNEFETFDEQDQ